MGFLMTKLSILLQLAMFLVHIRNRLFMTNNVKVIATSGTIFSVKSVVMDSINLERSQPCS